MAATTALSESKPKMKRAKKLPNPAPRNPLVAEALFRKAGAHGKSEKAMRRKEKMKLRKLASSTGIEPVIDP